MPATLAEIFEEFADLDREDQSQFLLELGDELPGFPVEQRTEANRVHGCQSQVWLIANAQGSGADARLEILADSDSTIVRGLIAILQAAYDGLTAAEILRYDIQAVFRQLNLQQHISPQRRNGLRGMVERIQLLAGRLAGTATTPVPLPLPGAVPVPEPQHPLLPRTVPGEAFDVLKIRSQFPVLNRRLPSGGFPVYLDSGASAQKPRVVIDAQRDVEEQYFANAHRGTYQFGVRIDEAFEGARGDVARFLHAPSPDSIVFTPGTTIGLNMIAAGWAVPRLRPGDEILTTVMEHHANFVPWQQAALRTGAVLRFLPLTPDGRLDSAQFDSAFTPRTRVVAVTAMSNMLGTINPIRELARRAHAVGACIVVDGAQSVPHLPTNVIADDIDFLVFSGHKVYGPTGVGVLYGRPERLEEMQPVHFGGHMISQVKLETSTWSAPPARFEAGTMPIVQVIGLGAAIRWIEAAGLEDIHAWEMHLTNMLYARLSQMEGIRIFGPKPEFRGGIISFRVDNVHPEDLAAILDQHDVFTRHGHHCTMPLHTALNVSATTRVSFGAYNTVDDVEAFLRALQQALNRLRR
ncbi:MAG: putative cysteine desulfurase [Planctomycetota bacterium]|jgi:cysteine desulfurase/selenocysteine lyase